MNHAQLYLHQKANHKSSRSMFASLLKPYTPKTDDLGQTPLPFAALVRRADIVAVLINMNANLFIRDNNGNPLFHFVDDPLVSGSSKT